MAVPKKRLTKRRIGNRRSQAHGKIGVIHLATCSNCSAKVMPHAVCAKCGYYKGKSVVATLL